MAAYDANVAFKQFVIAVIQQRILYDRGRYLNNVL